MLGLGGAAAGMAQTQRAVDTVTIDVDLGKAEGAAVPLYRWFGYDEGNYSTTVQGRALLGELHDLSPVPVYIRAHHLLTSGDGVPQLKWSSTNVYSEDATGKPVYDFRLLDGIFDAYKAAGVRPVVELGFMPKDLAAKLPGKPDQPYEVLYPKDTLAGASQNPPKDYAKWEELVRVVTAHLVERYGREEVLRWYFEVWNEPNIAYFHGTEDAYLKLYDYAVAGVRAALPGARVGGPATTSPRDAKAYGYLQTFLEHVATGKSAATGGIVPLDFITFHAKGQPTFKDGGVTMGIDRELMDVDRGFALIAGMPKFRKTPIILSEADPEGCAACSSKNNPANRYRNGTLYPTYTAAVYKRLFDLADARGVNLVGMLSWSFEFEGKDYFEGFRSLSTNGIDKPVLNVFRMFGMMGGTRAATTSTGEVPMATMLSTGVRGRPDVAAMATRGASEAAVLLWNYHDTVGEDEAAEVTVAVKGVPGTVRRALLEQYRIDGTHSNAYAVWMAMGSPQSPSAAQVAQLKQAGGLELMRSPEWVDVAEGKVVVKTQLPGESVGLLRLSW
ncbi:MAG: beta-xylosidase [Acidobacteria bacterium]|nr:beta-xylosidase [Acidobacteriota bacterium]